MFKIQAICGNERFQRKNLACSSRNSDGLSPSTSCKPMAMDQLHVPPLPAPQKSGIAQTTYICLRMPSNFCNYYLPRILRELKLSFFRSIFSSLHSCFLSYFNPQFFRKARGVLIIIIGILIFDKFSSTIFYRFYYL